MSLRELLRRAAGKFIYGRPKTILVGLRWRRRRRRECREAVARGLAAPRPPVLVYVMAKVGSSTVTSALEQIGQNVFQVHVMNPGNIRSLRSRVRKRGLAGFQMDTDIIGRSLYEGVIRPGHAAKVITLVREPIGRNVSFYFQTLDALWGTAGAHERVGLARLLGEFRDRFDHRRALDWFDTEFKPVLGIDVYGYEFPRDAGHLRITAGPYDVLILRTDLDDASKARRIEEFLGVEGVSLVRKNVSAGKPYADTYREFLGALELPEAYVDEMLGSKYARHFFGPRERASLRAKWLGRNGAPNPPP